ncbi:MAG TPA: hypothetical protein VH560_05405 [Polyangia bacterium]|nr:hypothetical protein [Polyangia bacterium]
MLPGPLHRLTRLNEDPAAQWLRPFDHAIVTVKGWIAWLCYFAFLYAARTVVWIFMASYLDSPALMAMFGRLAGRVPLLVGGALGAALLIPMRRTVVRLRASAIAKMARDAATDAAVAVDDLSALAADPDGRIVSLVGWVRGRAYVDRLVDGQRAVGLTLRCQDGMPFVLELMHNFDLVDEAGHEVLVATAEGRLFGESNVRLSRASQDDRQLVLSLDLPAAAVPTDWNVFVVRDGDPVMVLGTKTTLQDFTALQRDRSASITAVASVKGRPLLLFPLAAERREV